MKNELLTQVYNHPLIDTQELTNLINAHKKVSFKKGDFILKQGDISDGYMILESGLMRSFAYDYEGNDITTDFFCNYDIAIEVLSLFQRIPTTENIQALTDCDCLKLEFEECQEVYHSIPGLSLRGRPWIRYTLLPLKKNHKLFCIHH